MQDHIISCLVVKEMSLRTSNVGAFYLSYCLSITVILLRMDLCLLLKIDVSLVLDIFLRTEKECSSKDLL